jgi:hypothetical protein
MIDGFGLLGRQAEYYERKHYERGKSPMTCAKDHKKKTDENGSRDRVGEGKEYRQKILDKDKVESSVAETYVPDKQKK